MNEHVRALADKIWEEEYWTNPNTDKLLPAQLNRFAELIVRECLYLCESTAAGRDAEAIQQAIQQHFGVEE